MLSFSIKPTINKTKTQADSKTPDPDHLHFLDSRARV
jgi:hypothetical protein